MKNLIRIITLLVILLGVILIFNYCSKTSMQPEPDVVTETDGENGILSLNVPPSFNWKMSKTYDFTVQGIALNTVSITSLDRSIEYHKGRYIENGNGQYVVNVSIPTFVKQVKVNSEVVDLNSRTINVDLSQKAATVNYALAFDGIDDYVDFGDIAELNNVSEFTFETWVYQTTNTDMDRLFRKFSDSGNDIMISLWNGDLYVEIGNGSNAYGVWSDYATEIPSGTWFHFAVVFDGGEASNSDRLKLYVNGVQKTMSYNLTIPSTTSALLSGETAQLAVDGSIPAFFEGAVDELRIWDDVRSASEIADNYNEVIDPSSPNLITYYKFDEASGISTYDLTSNTYDGHLYNGVSWILGRGEFDSDADGVNDINDDYPLDNLRAYDNYWPASDTGTLVFEDLYPGFGDYDFNDMVIGYKFKIVTNALNNVVDIFSYTKVRAHGAQLDNGYGFELPTADVGLLSDLTVTGYNHTGSLVTLLPNGLEDGQTKPVVIVLDKVSNVMDKFVNTHETGAIAPPVTITVTMTPSGTYTMSDFNLDEWNPFPIIDQTRGYELHLAGQAPTDLGSTSYFGTFEDASDPGSNKYYVTAQNLPWALDFPTSFEYPFEKKEITAAYLHFREWAESGGALFTDWHTNTAPGYRNSIYIYTQTP